MQFHEYPLLFSVMRAAGVVPRGQSAVEWYRKAARHAMRVGEVPATTNQFISEATWCEARRPYYRCWPSIIPMLCKIKLDLPATSIKLPAPVFLVQFPVEGNPLRFGDDDEHAVQSILCTGANIRGTEGITIWISCGETMAAGDASPEIPIHFYRNWRSTIEGRTLDDEIRDLPDDEWASVGLQMPPELHRDVVRVICSLCLIAAGDGSGILEPDPLAKDAGKDLTEAVAARAFRRRGPGWNLGRAMTVSPHLRRAHLALQRYGKGRQKVKVIMRSGSVIHRKIVEKLPGGTLGPVPDDTDLN